jgi:hypothetical protein
MSIRRFFLAFALTLLGGLSALSPAQAQQDNLLETVKKRGKLQVGFSSFVPWAMRDKQGQWVGFEIDVSTKLAQDLGVQLELIPTAWDAIIPSLIAGKFDLIIGGMTITPARQEQIDFTSAYSTSGQGIAASRQLASQLKWPEGYNSPVGRDGAMLSGGQRPRVGLARALYGKPVFVVLDEPNSSLDEAGDAALSTAIASLKAEGTTFVIMTHRTSVLGVVDKLLILREGMQQAFGPRDEVLAALQSAQKRGPA